MRWQWKRNHAQSLGRHDHKIDRCALAKDLHLYGVHLVVEDASSRHLSAIKNSVIIMATGDRPHAAELNAAKVGDIPECEKQSLSKWEATNYTNGPAVSANLGIFELAMFFRQALPDSLFDVSGALVTLQDTYASSLVTRHGNRIFVKVCHRLCQLDRGLSRSESCTDANRHDFKGRVCRSNHLRLCHFRASLIAASFCSHKTGRRTKANHRCCNA